MNEEQKKRAIFEPSVDTQVIYTRLKKAEVGDVITYSELNDLIKADVQAGARHILHSARSMAVRDDKIVFDCISNVGIKRLTDEEIMGLPTYALRSIGRKCKRTSRKLHCADWEKMNPADKVKYAASASVLHAIAAVSKPKKIEELKASIPTDTKVLSLGKTLEAFK